MKSGSGGRSFTGFHPGYSLVGWVERSDTHQPGPHGYRSAQPILPAEVQRALIWSCAPLVDEKSVIHLTNGHHPVGTNSFAKQAEGLPCLCGSDFSRDAGLTQRVANEFAQKRQDRGSTPVGAISIAERTAGSPFGLAGAAALPIANEFAPTEKQSRPGMAPPVDGKAPSTLQGLG
ncbi:hypothetical protein FQZ97_1024770 [compost metagenome]